MTLDQAESLSDTREPSPLDRRQEKQFRADRPAKDLPCTHPGCDHKFRNSTQYGVVVDHWRRRHGWRADQ